MDLLDHEDGPHFFTTPGTEIMLSLIVNILKEVPTYGEENSQNQFKFY